MQTVSEINLQTLLSDPKIIATLIGAILTMIISITSSIISLITNYKNRKLIKEVEFLKSELQKETISYQIFRTEQTKRRFDKLDLLHEKLIDYIDFQKNKLSSDFNLVADSSELIKESNNLLNEAWTSLRKSRLYLADDLINTIQELLSNCRNATDNYLFRQHSKERFLEFTLMLIESVNKLEPLLLTIEEKIKLNLQESNKNWW